MFTCVVFRCNGLSTQMAVFVDTYAAFTNLYSNLTGRGGRAGIERVVYYTVNGGYARQTLNMRDVKVL